MSKTFVPGHFGEWLQGRLGPAGPVALITLACPVIGAHAPAQGPALFPAEALADFAHRLGLAAPLPGAAVDYPAGAGTGASTATLIAMARAAGFAGSALDLARACVATEGASDPLCFDQPDALLWASRTGQVLRDLTPPPRCQIVGGLWGPALATDPEDADFDDISDLVTDWAQAVAARDLAGCAALASASARRCAARRDPPGIADPTPDLARDLGALGWARAHTGSARALIFAPGRAPSQAAAAISEAGLTRVLAFQTGAEA